MLQFGVHIFCKYVLCKLDLKIMTNISTVLVFWALSINQFFYLKQCVGEWTLPLSRGRNPLEIRACSVDWAQLIRPFM
jgi:hypothetical protein